MSNPLQRYVEALFRRMQHAFRIGYTSAPATDGGAAQGLQVRFHELSTQDQVWHGQQYGHGSNPPVGTRVLVLAGHGDPTAAVAVATNHEPSRYRGSAPGHSWIDDASGSRLLFTNDGNAKLVVAGTFTIQIGDTTFVFSETGLTSTGGVTAGLGTADQVTLQHHTHPTAAPGGPSMPTPGT